LHGWAYLLALESSNFDSYVIEISILILLLNGALLIGSAIFLSQYQTAALAALMLLTPYLDKAFQPQLTFVNKPLNIFIATFSIAICTFGFIYEYLSLELIIYTLTISALAEEWFFRVYFQSKVITFTLNFTNKKLGVLTGIVLTSIFFSGLHAIAQNNMLMMALIFFPSMIYGYIYYKTRDFLLITNIHFISNILLYLLKPN